MMNFQRIKECRRVLIILTLVILCFLLSVTAFAHPGRTDGNGGHYDASTGEYHYHHGYPPHQHTNGKCPYYFKDRTNHSSPRSSGSRVTNNAVANGSALVPTEQYTEAKEAVPGTKASLNVKKNTAIIVLLIIGTIAAILFVCFKLRDDDLKKLDEKDTGKSSTSQFVNSDELEYIADLEERLSPLFQVLYVDSDRRSNEWEENDMMLFILFISCFYLSSRQKCGETAIRKYLESQIPKLVMLSKSSSEAFEKMFEDRFELYKRRLNMSSGAIDGLNSLITTFGELTEADYYLEKFFATKYGIPSVDRQSKPLKYPDIKAYCLFVLNSVMQICDPTLD